MKNDDIQQHKFSWNTEETEMATIFADSHSKSRQMDQKKPLNRIRSSSYRQRLKGEQEDQPERLEDELNDFENGEEAKATQK